MPFAQARDVLDASGCNLDLAFLQCNFPNGNFFLLELTRAIEPQRVFSISFVYCDAADIATSEQAVLQAFPGSVAGARGFINWEEWQPLAQDTEFRFGKGASNCGPNMYYQIDIRDPLIWQADKLAYEELLKGKFVTPKF